MAGFGDFLSNLGKPAPAPTPEQPNKGAAGQPNTGAAGQPKPQAPADILTQFGELFSREVTKPAVPGEAPIDPFSINTKSLQDAAGQINMAQVIQPELMQRALGGDSAAMLEMLNKSSQMTFMMAYQAALEASKGGVDQRLSSFEDKMPATFKRLSVDATLQENPLFNNPALKPMVEGVRSQITAKHPDATAAQVDQAITEYFKAVGAKFTPEPDSAEVKNGSSKQPDWENFLK